jgi:hypothetical protein
MRAIITKHGWVYELAPDQQGIPVDDHFPGVSLPEPLK